LAVVATAAQPVADQPHIKDQTAAIRYLVPLHLLVAAAAPVMAQLQVVWMVVLAAVQVVLELPALQLLLD
jgi:hypothetical protein